MARMFLVLVFVGLAVAVGSCGGSGGGAQPGPPSFSGTYWFLLFEPESSGGDASASWGTAVSDGVSSVTLNGADNNGGVLSAGGSQVLDYTIDADGTLRFLQAATEVVAGGLGADGRCAVLAASSATISPVMIVMIRSSGSYSTASLMGDFHMSGYSVTSVSVSLFSTKPAFDGVGGYSGSGAANEDGSLDGGAISGSYTVAADGQATVDLFGETQEGCLLDGSSFGAFAGGNTAGDDPAMVLLMRAGSGSSTATFSGSYWVVGVELNLGGGNFESTYGTATADGAGGLTIAATVHNGTTLNPIAGTALYSVAPDGTLVLNRSGVAGTEDLTGAVSPDGRIAMIGGGAVLGSNPVLFVLCRK